MTHALFKILKHVFLENEARLVLLNLALNFFSPKYRPLKVYGILNNELLSAAVLELSDCFLQSRVPSKVL